MPPRLRPTLLERIGLVAAGVLFLGVLAVEAGFVGWLLLHAPVR